MDSKIIVALLLLAWSLTIDGANCPAECQCHQNYTIVDCSYRQDGTKSRMTTMKNDIPLSVKVLNYTGHSITFINATTLGKLRDLVTLDMSLNQVHYIELGAFANLEKLRDLNLTGSSIGVTPSGGFSNEIVKDLQEHCKHDPNARSKTEDCTNVDRIVSSQIENFRDLNKLEVLTLRSTNAGPSGFGDVPSDLMLGLPMLRKLDVSRRVFKIGSNNVTNCNLQQLDVSYTLTHSLAFVPGTSYCFLRNCPLEWLNLAGSVPLNSLDRESFRCLRQLKTVILDGKADTDQLSFMIHAMTNSRVSRISLNRMRQSNGEKQPIDQILQTLRDANLGSQLHSLWINDNKNAVIETSMGSFPNLKTLSLKGSCPKSSCGLPRFGLGLETLDMSGNNIEDKDFPLQAQGVLYPSLKELDLSDNRLNVLNQSLGCCRTLEVLKLDRNNIYSIAGNFFMPLKKLRELNIAVDSEMVSSATGTARTINIPTVESLHLQVDKFRRPLNLEAPLLQQMSISYKCDQGEPRVESCPNGAILNHDTQTDAIFHTLEKLEVLEIKSDPNTCDSCAIINSTRWARAMKFLPELTELHLRGQELSDLIPQTLNNLSLLDIREDPVFSCKCENAGFIEWLQNKTSWQNFTLVGATDDPATITCDQVGNDISVLEVKINDICNITDLSTQPTSTTSGKEKNVFYSKILLMIVLLTSTSMKHQK